MNSRLLIAQNETLRELSFRLIAERQQLREAIELGLGLVATSDIVYSAVDGTKRTGHEVAAIMMAALDNAAEERLYHTMKWLGQTQVVATAPHNDGLHIVTLLASEPAAACIVAMVEETSRLHRGEAES